MHITVVAPYHPFVFTQQTSLVNSYIYFLFFPVFPLIFHREPCHGHSNVQTSCLYGLDLCLGTPVLPSFLMHIKRKRYLPKSSLTSQFGTCSEEKRMLFPQHLQTGEAINSSFLKSFHHIINKFKDSCDCSHILFK